MQKQRCLISYTEKTLKFATEFHQSMSIFRKKTQNNFLFIVKETCCHDISVA